MWKTAAEKRCTCSCFSLRWSSDHRSNQITRSFTRIPPLRDYRYQPDQVGKNCRFLQGPTQTRKRLLKFAPALRNEERSKPLLNYRKDGQPFWNELKISPVFSDEGNLLYFVGIQTDITERKQTEQKVCEAALLDVTTDAIIVRDLITKSYSGTKALNTCTTGMLLMPAGNNLNEALYQEASPQLKKPKRPFSSKASGMVS